MAAFGQQSDAVGEMAQAAWISAIILLLAGAGCDFPRDADGTLDRVRREHVMRVGVSERPPWVSIEQGAVLGIEPDLVRDWATVLGAEPKWVRGTESALVHALGKRQIDMVVAGLTKRSPWTDRAAPTQRCLRSSIVVAVPSGVTAPRSNDDITGRIIAHSSERPDFAAIIAAKDAKPQPVADVRGRIAAVYDFEAARLGLIASGVVLAREDQVMLVAPGESAFLLQLDRFLSRACRTAVSDDSIDEVGRTS